LTPEEFTVSSNKKIWWQCPRSKLHVWETAISHRTKNDGTGCPFCSGKKTCADNNLAFLRPDIAEQWHQTKNPKLNPEQVTISSHKKAWWQCSKSDLHVWETAISHRTNETGCPYCTGRRVCADNNLAALRPEVAAQWHPTKNLDLTPEQVTVSTHKKAWWQCQKNKRHVWETGIYNRTKVNGTGCPECYSLRRKK
jgi:positive regulator of sigma E activity